MTAAGDAAPAGSRARDRRRWSIACAVAGLFAVILFAALLSAGDRTLLVTEPFGSDFYDAQAHALMHGRWNVPARVVGIDGFQVGSKYYMYFGIWPSVLRMPVLLLSSSLSGKLTRPSMLLAFVVLLVGASLLAWRV
jgi:hypothetical protein